MRLPGGYMVIFESPSVLAWRAAPARARRPCDQIGLTPAADANGLGNMARRGCSGSPSHIAVPRPRCRIDLYLNQGAACGVAGPAPAPGSALGRPARRSRATPRGPPGQRWHTRHPRPTQCAADNLATRLSCSWEALTETRPPAGPPPVAGQGVGLPARPEPMAVLGAPGIGKSTICLAALDDGQVAGRFGDRRWFVRCDGATSAAALLSGLAAELGVTGDGPGGVMDGVCAALGAELGVIVLDNFETPGPPTRSSGGAAAGHRHHPAGGAGGQPSGNRWPRSRRGGGLSGSRCLSGWPGPAGS
jgi:hypothetical protein